MFFRNKFIFLLNFFFLIYLINNLLIKLKYFSLIIFFIDLWSIHNI